MSDQQDAELSFLIRYGNFLFRYRNMLFPVIVVGILLLFVPAMGTDGASCWVDLAGYGVVLFGVGLRALVVSMEYIKRGGLDKKVYADDLVTGGMFNHCRNPLYVGNLAIILGTFLIHGNPVAVAIGFGYFILSYIAIVAAEENFLRGKFGEQYDAYTRRTPRWWIHLSGIGNTLSEHRFNWRRVIAKEYTTDATAVLTILVILGYQRVVAARLVEGAVDLSAIIAAAVTVGAVTLMIRVIKKSGGLRDS